MHFVVCIKQVPDSAQIRVHPVTNTIMRQGVPTIINPYDLFALEEAMRLRDVHGGEVTVLTMGPPMAEDSLRKALTYGADRAVLLTDRFFAGSDTLATSFALAQAIRKIGETWGRPDIVFAGKQTIDGDTAQVGPGIARRLDLVQLTYISKISSLDAAARTIDRGATRRGRRAGAACDVALPDHDAGRLQRNSSRQFPDALRAARAEIVTWSAAAAGIEDMLKCGLRGSPTVVKRVFAPTPRADKAKQIDVQAARIGNRGAPLSKPCLKFARRWKAISSNSPPDSEEQRHVGEARILPAAAGRAAMKKELPEQFKAYRNVWVLVELEHGQVHPVSWELMGEGRKLADRLGVELAGAVIGGVGAGAREAAMECFAYGADIAYLVENPVLADYRNKSFTRALTELVNTYKPEILLLGATESRPRSRRIRRHDAARRASPPIAPNWRSTPTNRSRRRARPSAVRCCARSTR